jgi:hypothetical protein
MNLSDTFYVALCMTVLILGVVYWFWTQNQYIQRKLNLLENIVYEMKTTLASSASADSGSCSLPTPDSMQEANDLKPAVYPPAPSSVLGEDEDLLHEELTKEAGKANVQDDIEDAIADFAIDNSQPLGAEVIDDVPFDLQPGGIGSGIKEVIAPDSSAKGSVLDTMTINELKRLAEQRGITGIAKMRKQALIDAIRNAPVASPFDSSEGTIEFS